MRAHLVLLSVALAIGLIGASHIDSAVAESGPIEGRIVVISSAVAMSADGTVTGPERSLLLDVDGEFMSAGLNDETEVVSADGRPLSVSQLRPGNHVLIDGARERPD